MTPHTPGPWRVEGVEIYGANGQHVVWELGNTNAADAALIAAAPELLACSRELLVALETSATELKDLIGYANRLRDIVRKADGGW